MSSGCGDVLTLEDLKTAKKHQTFEAEVITGKQGGVAAGADIDFTTNPVTGQTQKTLPAILRDAGFFPASFDFATGGTLTTNDRDKVVYDPASKTWYSWGGALPKVIPAGFNPVGATDWRPQTDPNLRGELASPTGYTLVPSVFPEADKQRWKDTGDIRGWGAVPGTDCSAALQAAIADRAALGYGTSSDIIMDGSYRIDSQVIITSDVRIRGNWATITSSLNDYIFISGYKDGSGNIVSNLELDDLTAVATARLKGVQISGITFVDCAKVFNFKLFNERCELSDLYFERCGVAWEMWLPFYSSFRNIFIRSAKTGYENYYAYIFGRQTNLVNLYKVTVSERQYGTFMHDSDTLPGKLNVFYELVHFNQCSWEHVNYPVTLDMKGYGFRVTDWYSEVVTGPLFRVLSGDHYDLTITPANWLAGVENMGEFKNLKGRSSISQGSQNDYPTPKPASLLFENSVCEVLTAPENGFGTRINYDINSVIKVNTPVGAKTNNTTSGEIVPNTVGVVPTNVNNSNVTSVVSGTVTLSTKIKFSKFNMLAISLDLNAYDCGLVVIGTQVIKQYGYTFTVGADGSGYTYISIAGTGLNTIGEVILAGCIRFM
ncbi:MAG: hypothetical protein RSC43_00760 [Clostridia bacterium]